MVARRTYRRYKLKVGDKVKDAEMGEYWTAYVEKVSPSYIIVKDSNAMRIKYQKHHFKHLRKVKRR